MADGAARATSCRFKEKECSPQMRKRLWCGGPQRGCLRRRGRGVMEGSRLLEGVGGELLQLRAPKSVVTAGAKRGLGVERAGRSLMTVVRRESH